MSFASLSLECVHKPEQPNQQESGGRARALLFRAYVEDDKKCGAGEEGLRRAKLIRQCCSLRVQSVLYTVL